MNYFTIIDVITSLTLLVLTFLVYENSRLDKKTKNKFYLVYIFIFLAMLAEWASIQMNQAPTWTMGLHRVVKCLDYILTPMVGVLLANQISERNKVQKRMEILVTVNAICQIVSIFTGWTFYIDDNNIYQRGPLYGLYIIIYMVIIMGVLTEFYLYGKKYKRQNKTSLFGIIFMIFVGVFLEQFFSFKIIYLTMAICAALLYIHYCEFTQLTSDENLLYQKKLLEIDSLTGLFNRYAYTNDLKELEHRKGLSANLVIFSVDINELKAINDNLGHLAGDELIQGTAKCIKKALAKYGKCYRTGGDEFITILYTDENQAFWLKSLLEKEAELWHGAAVKSLSLSIGYVLAKDYPESQIEELIHLADEKMYEAKAQYYVQSGKNRRKRDGNTRKDESIEAKKQEYMDIISALSSDVTGLYMIDRKKREVTAYRISALDHRIRSGVPLKQGFEVAMTHFIEKNVHPDDKELMIRSIQLDFIERELSMNQSFICHFRSLNNGEIHFHYMKCIANITDDEFDKIIISFCPEDNQVSRKQIQEALRSDGSSKLNTILIATSNQEDQNSLHRELASDYEIYTANDGEEALDILKSFYRSISVILIDQNTDALKFLETVKEDIFLSSVPVVLMTEKDDLEIEEKCIHAGAVDFIKKPFNYVVLRRRLENMIRMNRMTASLEEIEIDDLTGLYTKQAFLYHAQTLVDANPNEDFTIILSDIENFKMYNSIYGENRGNEILETLADYIRKVVVNGISARFGADQFVSIIKSPKNVDIADYIREMQDYVDREIDENIVLNFGIYENADKTIVVDRMCDRALVALRSIKHTYDQMYARFDGPVSQQLYKAQMYESRFREALDNGEFFVCYQPKYNPYTEKVVGAEALVRWDLYHEQLIPPSDFLPVFEANGMISQLDEYVFRTVCEYQRKRNERGLELFPISVNLSRNSMHQVGVVKRYKDIVDACGISTEMIPIEITESAAIDTIEIKPLADAFYEAGFSLHMDDFGSEHSSLTGLTVLHFDVVKLDKSLIDYIGDPQGNLVLMYTIALGKELGLHLVAEGVENKDQLNYLKDNGCDFVQGYYFCKPLLEADFDMVISGNLESQSAIYDHRYKLTASDSVVKRAMDRMLHRMPGGFFTYKRNEDERILSSNRYLWKLFGCETETEFMDHVGGSFKGVVCPEELDEVEAYIDQQIRGSDMDMDNVRYHIIRKDGTRIPVVDYGHLDRQPDGDIFYVFISEDKE